MNVVAKLHAHGVNGKTIAAVLGCSKGAVSLWKHGKRQPSPANHKRLLALAKFAGVNVSQQQAEAA